MKMVHIYFCFSSYFKSGQIYYKLAQTLLLQFGVVLITTNLAGLLQMGADLSQIMAAANVLGKGYCCHFDVFYANPLSANPTKWSNTLSVFWVFYQFVGLALKGLILNKSIAFS